MCITSNSKYHQQATTHATSLVSVSVSVAEHAVVVALYYVSCLAVLLLVSHPNAKALIKD
jgi:hypothetical protein